MTRPPLVPCHSCRAPTRRTEARKRDGTPAELSFCSRACYFAHHSRRVEWQCRGCGARELLKPSAAERRVYCSRACRTKHLRPGPVHCVNCGAWFSALKWNGQRRFVVVSGVKTCSRACDLAWRSNNEDRKRKIGRAFAGDRHPNWKGGRTLLDRRAYRGAGWSRIAEAARVRAGRCCERCGRSEAENGERLSVHHVVPFHNFRSSREANRPENLQALCRSCHMIAEAQVPAVQLSLGLGTGRGSRGGARVKRGSDHPAAKLQEGDVFTIRRRAAAGASMAGLAREYGVSFTTVWGIVRRKTWRHLPERQAA